MGSVQKLRLSVTLSALPLWLVLVVLPAFSAPVGDDDDSFDTFEYDEAFAVGDDRPLEEAITHPPWFKLSFLDLAEDLNDAIRAGKQGLLVYFGQKYCSYCKAMLEGNFGKLDILAYTQKHFDVIGIDIHGQKEVTDFAGKVWTERTFSVANRVNFTPTLIFYDRNQREALRLPGFYPPYKFRAALEYVADEYYLKEDFRSYLARADVGTVFEAGDMNFEEFFPTGPQLLDRSRLPGQRPLVVFFEQGDCHACDVLHTGPLRDPDILAQFYKLDSAQLNMWEDTPVITPTGEKTTARKWADQLGLFYTPTLIFFDRQGREIIRVDSVVQFYRLQNVLDYVISGAYREYPTFQQWRRANER